MVTKEMVKTMKPGSVIADEPLSKGLNVWNGKVTNKFVTDSLGLEYTPFQP